MMRLLRAEKPVPTPAVQFSGGEPTMRDDLPGEIPLVEVDLHPDLKPERSGQDILLRVEDRLSRGEHPCVHEILDVTLVRAYARLTRG